MLIISDQIRSDHTKPDQTLTVKRLKGTETMVRMKLMFGNPTSWNKKSKMGSILTHAPPVEHSYRISTSLWVYQFGIDDGPNHGSVCFLQPENYPFDFREIEGVKSGLYLYCRDIHRVYPNPSPRTPNRWDLSSAPEEKEKWRCEPRVR